MNQPYRGFQEKTQEVPFPLLVVTRVPDAGNQGVFIDLHGQGCVDVHNGRFQGSHGLLMYNPIHFYSISFQQRERMG